MKKKHIGICYVLSLPKFKHIFRVMKLTLMSLLLCVSGVFAIDANSQAAHVNIRATNLRAKEIINQIEVQTDYLFVYNNKTVDLNNLVSLNVSDIPVTEVLNKIFECSDIVYVMEGNNILLMKKSIQPQQKQKRIEGTVSDQKGEPIIGANVVEKGTTNGTVTDLDGKYSLEISDGAILQYSYIGYIAKEEKIGSKSKLDIQLTEDMQKLEEIVVVGYGTQKKINLTGAVEVITGEKLEGRSVSTISQALQGQISGANFMPGVNGYEPGASLSFQIRGQGDAYVLVDGVATDLNTINPTDIESISVLKDAAAASIYGAQASYGVVLVTTKSGKKEQKPVVNFSSNIAFTKLHRMPSMVDSYTFAKMMNEAGENGGGRAFNDETIDRIIAFQKNPSLPETVPSEVSPGKWADLQYSNANYDWFEEFYGTGMNNQENISVRGGSKKINYYVSAGHVYDSGILNYATDDYRRVNTIAKIDIELTDWWDININNRFQKSRRIKPNFDDQGDYELLFHQIARTSPTEAKVTPNGYYTRLSKIPWVQDSGFDETIGYEAMQRFATEIRPIKGWSINADYTYKLYSSKFASKNFTVYEDLVDGTLVPIGTTYPSYVAENQNNSFYTSFNAYTTYVFGLNNVHNFAVMAGIQQEQERNEGLAGRKNDIVTNEIPSISTSTGEIHSLSDNLAHWSRLGMFFRVGYNYKERYLFEANGRFDGTSKFAKGNRWGFFPSFSLGWSISREKFFEKLLDKVNALKVRASWGSLGNQNVDAYQDLALLGINSNLDWLIDGKRPVYVTAPNLINPNLTWETSETIDCGVDIGVLNNRLNITADWYQRHTRNRLGPAEALPSVIGAVIPKMNNSELRTNGWELMISWRDRINDDFSYTISAMLYDYYSTVTKYNNPTNILTTDYEGMKVGEIWGYTTEGLIQSEEEARKIMETGSQRKFHSVWNVGDVKYSDLNRDGVVNDGKNTKEDHGDLSIIGNTTPRYQYSFSIGAEYKGFDFNMMFQGVAKRDLWIDSNMFWGFGILTQSSLFAGDHWDYYRDVEADTYSGLGVNTDSYFPRPYLVNALNNKNREVQTRYLQNGAYLRLKNLQIGYTIPKSLSRKIALSKVRFYFSGDNLFTMTGRFPESLDPENAIIGMRGAGKSMNAQSIYSFGIEVEF